MLGASLMAQMVKRLPAMLETWVRSLGQEDPLEKEIATHSSTLAWKIPRTEEPGRLQSVGSQRVGHDWVNLLHFFQKSNQLETFNYSPSPFLPFPFSFQGAVQGLQLNLQLFSLFASCYTSPLSVSVPLLLPDTLCLVVPNCLPF